MPKAARVIFATVFIDLVGFGIVIPVLPLYAERFGASPLVIGCLLAVYSAMQFVCAPLLGKLSDRVGRRPVLLVSILGTAIGFFLMGLAQTLWMLFVARVIDGITGGNISTAMAYIADVTRPDERSRGMGLIGAAFGLGFIFGPAIGGLLSHVSLGAPFLFAGALATANAAAIYWWLPESMPPERRAQAQRHSSLAELFRGPARRALGTAIATAFFITVSFSLLTATYPLFTERRFGLSAPQNGYIFAAQGIVGAVIQGGLLGGLVRRFREQRLVVAGTVVLAASFFLIPLSATMAALLSVTLGVAVGHSLTTATLNGLASKAVGASAQGRALGVMQSAASLARIVGPVLGGWLLHYDAGQQGTAFGTSPYWAGAAILVIGCASSLAL